MKKIPSKRYKCKYPFCPNHYDDVIGHEPFGQSKAGGACVPCLYAEQMVNQGLTLDRVKEIPALMKQFTDLLGKTGWTWEDMEASYKRMQVAPKELRVC